MTIPFRYSKCVLALLFTGGVSFAQLATIQGEARDSTNAVLPGAHVTVTNTRT
jgi:hypothetical protein